MSAISRRLAIARCEAIDQVIEAGLGTTRHGARVRFGPRMNGYRVAELVRAARVAAAAGRH